MLKSNVTDIKRSQKESLLLKELSKMLLELSLDDPELEGLHINKVQLSRDKGTCFIFFYTPEGAEAFRKQLKKLILYKPSLRKGIAAALDTRYVPELKFAFDAQFEKQQRIENILEKVKKEF